MFWISCVFGLQNCRSTAQMGYRWIYQCDVYATLYVLQYHNMQIYIKDCAPLIFHHCFTATDCGLISMWVKCTYRIPLPTILWCLRAFLLPATPIHANVLRRIFAFRANIVLLTISTRSDGRGTLHGSMLSLPQPFASYQWGGSQSNRLPFRFHRHWNPHEWHLQIHLGASILCIQSMQA